MTDRTATERGRRYRERKRLGAVICRVEFGWETLEQMLDCGLLTDGQAKDPAYVANLAQRIVNSWLKARLAKVMTSRVTAAASHVGNVFTMARKN